MGYIYGRGEQALPLLPYRHRHPTHHAKATAKDDNTTQFLRERNMNKMPKKKNSEQDDVKQQEFGRKYRDTLENLAKAITVRKTAEKAEEETRQAILTALKQEDLPCFTDDKITVRFVPAQDDKVVIDFSKLKADNESLYSELLTKYPKQIKGRGESTWVKVKG